MRKEVYQPSDSELEILHILWEHEPTSVRTVHNLITSNGAKSVGYTTVLKQMQRLFDKGVVTRELRGKTHFYTVMLKQADVQQKMYRQFLDRVFHGSAKKLVMHALGNSDTSPEEIKYLQKWIEQQKKSSNG